MSELLPLFPLGAVLYPGMVLPLHIFEDRYRRLIDDLLAGPEPRRFGVIAIREGRETGVDGVASLYDICCVAELRDANRHEDGRFDVVTIGTQRFRLRQLDQSQPYFQGEIDLLPEDDPDTAEAIAAVPPAQLDRGRIKVQVKREGGDIVVDVFDNGIGLPKDNRNRLLEPYVTTREKGTGLGLAIVGRILEEHGGRLELHDAAEKTPGARGAWMQLRFAAESVPAAATAAAAE